MSGQDAQEWRDDVSIWCYDGACETCDDGGCEHHCHHGVDGRVRRDADFATRGLTAVGLVVWASIGAVQTLDGLEWSAMTKWAVKILAVLLLWTAGGFVVRGLVGFKKDEEGEQ